MKYIVFYQDIFYDAILDELKIDDNSMKKLFESCALLYFNDIEKIRKSKFIRHFYDVKFELNGNETTNNETKSILDFIKSNLKTKEFALHALYYQHESKTSVILEDLINNGFINNLENPQSIVSITFVNNSVFLGINFKDELPTNYKGGQPHFKENKDTICRAEFKLLEAIKNFKIDFSNDKTAIDLGASPGGWSKVLIEYGLKVDAIDPAFLDPRIENHVEHYQMTTQEFLKNHYNMKYDVIVNDMKMNADYSCNLMNEFSQYLKTNGKAIVTLKLISIDYSNEEVDDALDILKECYNIIAVKQLFHNRQELTVYLNKK